MDVFYCRVLAGRYRHSGSKGESWPLLGQVTPTKKKGASVRLKHAGRYTMRPLGDGTAETTGAYRKAMKSVGIGSGGVGSGAEGVKAAVSALPCWWMGAVAPWWNFSYYIGSEIWSLQG